MAEMLVQERVQSVFEIIDKASGNAVKMAKNMDALQRKAERARKSVAKAGGGGKGRAVGEFSAQEVGTFKEEQRVERMRQAVAREAAEKHRLAGQAVLTGAMLLGSSMNSTAGRILAMGSTVASLGIEMSQLGGKLGKFGGNLAKAGGVFTAFAAGYEIGSKLDEWLGVSDKIVDSIIFINKDLNLTEGAMKNANLNYVKARGYRTAQEYLAAKGAANSMEQEARIQTAAKKYASDIGALPTGATLAEMEAFNAKVMAAANSIQKDINAPAKDFGDIVRATKEFAAAGLPAQAAMLKERQTREIMLQDAIEKQAETLGALPTNATKEQMIAYSQRVQEAGLKILGSANFIGASLEDVVESLKGAAEKSLGAIVESGREREVREAIVNDDLDKSAKQLKKLASQKGILAQEALINAQWDEAKRIANMRFGGRAAASEVERIYGELKTKTKKDLSKTNFDFRNSRFDIKQEFAEGFDPDRVYAAFANDVASMGERKMQSAFSPLLSVR